MSADASTTSPDFLAKLQPGHKLAGCYLLKEQVKGTPRPVWLAHDEVLGKDISLHFLPPGFLARGGVAERLRQEVKRSRQFIHPHILRVYDLIEEEEWAAIAMDTFTNRPLAAVMAANERGFFEVADVWPFVREMCETLDDAHRIRLTHGGLSPDDVLVGDGQLKLMNFGVNACLREAAEDEKSAAFASPQQLAGGKPVIADDIFALGALIHTLLAGSPPFDGAERQSAPPTVAEHRRRLNRQGGEVPEGWERVIASCLAAEPAARPGTCGETAKSLDLSGPPLVAEIKPAQPEPAVSSVKPEEATETEAAPKQEVAAAMTEVKAAPETKSETIPDQAPDKMPEDAQTKSHGPERRVKTSAAAAPAQEVRVDRDELKDTVQREEAEEDARSRGYLDEDEGSYVRPQGGSPSMLTWVIIVTVTAIVGFILYRVFFGESSTSSSSRVTDVKLSETTPAPATPPRATPAPATPAPVVKKAPTTPLPAEPTKMAEKKTEPVPASAATPAPSPVEPDKKTVEVEQARKAAEEAERQFSAAGEAQKQIETSMTEIKQTAEKTGKDLPAAKKAADDLSAQQKKLEDELKKVELAAQDAEKAAAEKKQKAEDARKAATTSAEQLSAKKAEITRAEEQLTKMLSDLQDKERALADAKKSAADAMKRRDTETARLKESEKSTAAVKSTATPKADAGPSPNDPRSAFEQKMKELGKVLNSTPATTSPEGSKPAMELAKAITPKPADTVQPAGDNVRKPAAAESGDGSINSLGMKFVPLPGSDALICVWPTRVRDFEVFARTTGLKSSLWKDPGFKQGPDHPVVNVTWQEAVAFCKWLTIKEQREGLISAKQSYRLTTDLEWSRGAGLATENGTTPEARDMGVPDVYPWGNAWPPPTGSGNYTGEETGSDVAIKGYNDGFPWTSPVGSFPPNKLGLYDMGGNVWQWCMDSWNAESKAKVLRGASWYNGALKLSLLTSCRVHASPDSSTDNYGFRIVLSGEASKAAKK